eukprot:gnl/Spiro4/13270_TR7047_c0_g1_i1.p1 gnl/Spiro4/13270_TR7047_c0_g1~~gnl/Spiro4/13270_TR7047_c0_g1_i1.p1  ORF type:complete len:207 (-),score=68.66 gnl/Spiro4/13270_TR7047_c0_g1_i1:169-750(-)
MLGDAYRCVRRNGASACGAELTAAALADLKLTKRKEFISAAASAEKCLAQKANDSSACKSELKEVSQALKKSHKFDLLATDMAARLNPYLLAEGTDREEDALAAAIVAEKNGFDARQAFWACDALNIAPMDLDTQVYNMKLSPLYSEEYYEEMHPCRESRRHYFEAISITRSNAEVLKKLITLGCAADFFDSL